jgi:hypothetical protein
VLAARQALSDVGGRGPHRPAVVAHDIWLASGLETVLPETVVMCLQRSSAVDDLRDRGIEVFCLSEHVPPADVAGRSSADLVEHPATIEFCRRLGPLAVITFKPSERFDLAVRNLWGTAIGAARQQLTAARSFENKLNFVEVAKSAGLPTPRWENLSVDQLADYKGLASRFGPRLVVQGARGNAGQRTWMVAGAADLAHVRRREAGPTVRVAELVGGMPFTVNAVAGTDGILDWSLPSRQVTGIPWLTPHQLGSCGNAWGEPALQPRLEDIGLALARIGTALSGAGFRGLFGVDFVLGAGGPVVIETNPRMVASVPLATQVELSGGLVPLLLRHLLVGLGVTDNSAEVAAPSGVGSAAARPSLPEPLPPASQVILHRLDKSADERANTVSGVYGLGGDEPHFLRPGVWLSDLSGAADEALVLVREAGEPVTPGREFARIYMHGAEGERTPGLRGLVEFLRRS